MTTESATGNTRLAPRTEKWYKWKAGEIQSLGFIIVIVMYECHFLNFDRCGIKCYHFMG